MALPGEPLKGLLPAPPTAATEREQVCTVRWRLWKGREWRLAVAAAAAAAACRAKIGALGPMI
jgi:hypothetical protein